MKLRHILLLFTLVYFQSCVDSNPEINIEPEIEDLSTKGKVVLLEVLQGASCVPCADAMEVMEDLESIYDDQMVVVAYHTFEQPMTHPVSGAVYDFRTQKSQDIINAFGKPLGIPTALIDRSEFDSEYFLQKHKWSGQIGEQITTTPIVGIHTATEYLPASRTLNVTLTVFPRTDITGDFRFYALLKEDNLSDLQYTQDGVKELMHNDIFRDMITDVSGDILGSELIKDAPITKNFSYTLPDEDGWWVAENLELVTFVAKIEDDSKEVLQVHSKNIID